jgi:hypothetical protein
MNQHTVPIAGIAKNGSDSNAPMFVVLQISRVVGVEVVERGTRVEAGDVPCACTCVRLVPAKPPASKRPAYLRSAGTAMLRSVLPITTWVDVSSPG